MSKFFLAFMRTLGIEPKNTTLYHPQTSGLVKQSKNRLATK